MLFEIQTIGRCRAVSTCCPASGSTLGFTLLYLMLIVLIPLAGAARRARHRWRGTAFWQTITDPRVVASYRLTFGDVLLGGVRQRASSA